MTWKKFTIYTTTAAEDLISLMLNEYGVGGVEIENNVPLSDSDVGEMFIDILPETEPDDGSSKVSFYLRLAGEKDDDTFDETGKNEGAGTAASDDSYSVHDKIWSEGMISKLLKDIRSDIEAMRGFIDIGEGRIEEGISEDTDWRDNWKRFFKPVRAGRFYIRPAWEKDPAAPEQETAEAGLSTPGITGTKASESELQREKDNEARKAESELPGEKEGSFEDISEPPGRDDIVINIDPGTAFGTGSHETTRLCLEALGRYVNPGDAVLDIGTGSGILGIASLKAGASFVAATDLDEMCRPSIETNLKENGISAEDFGFYTGNILTDSDLASGIRNLCPKGYDSAVANILAPVIEGLAKPGCVDSLIKEGGIFICSGIIDEKTDEVTEAFNANPSWKIIETTALGEWRGITAKRVRESI